MDIDKKAFDKVEKKAKHKGLKNVICIDSSSEEEILIEDDTVDYVLLIDVLQEIDGRQALFNEVYRITKPNGVLTVYPMHMKIEEVESLAVSKGFALQDRKFEKHILLFKRAVSSHT